MISWPLVVVGVVVGPFLSLLDATIVGSALPELQKQLTANIYDIEWVDTAAKVGTAAIVPAAAWLGNRLGLRRTIICSLIAYAVSSALCAVAPDLTSLVVFRILQAVPGGITPVVCVMVLSRLVPRARFVLAMSCYGTGVVLAPALAPLIGGVLVDQFDWRAVFWVSVPLALLGLVLAVRFLPPLPSEPSPPFDLLGFVLVAAGIGALIVVTSKWQEWGWSSYEILILIAGGINLLALFVAVELSTAFPLLELRLLTRRSFRIAIVLVTVLFGNLLTVLSSVPEFLGGVQGTTGTNVGLVLLPAGILWLAMMPIGGQLLLRFGAHWPAFTGLVVMGLATIGLQSVNVDLPRTETGMIMALWAFGIGLALVPVMAATVMGLPPELSNHGLTGRVLGQKVTATFVVTLLGGMQRLRQAQITADRFSLLSFSGADQNPSILRLQQQRPAALLELWRQIQNQTLASSYNSIFLLIGAVTALAGLLVLLSQWGRSTPPSPSIPTGTRR
jgi:EmrB/QacA subfamily drug resistance transporter